MSPYIVNYGWLHDGSVGCPTFLDAVWVLAEKTATHSLPGFPGPMITRMEYADFDTSGLTEAQTYFLQSLRL